MQFKVLFQLGFLTAFVALIAFGRNLPGHAFRNAFIGLVAFAVIFDLAFRKRSL